MTAWPTHRARRVKRAQHTRWEKRQRRLARRTARRTKRPAPVVVGL